MERYLISDPSRPEGAEHNVVGSWEDVGDELDTFDVEPPKFGEPVQIEDGNSLITVTRLE